MKGKKTGSLLPNTLFCLVLLGVGGFSHADDYPNRPIEFVIPFAAGGSTDINSRLLVGIASKELGQPFVSVNKTGGGGSVGAAYLASAKPDGYTVGSFSLGGMEFQPHLVKVPYDPLKDIIPIMQWGEYPQAIAVKSDSPFKTFKDLVKYSRENPGKVTFGSPGVGGAPHITTERMLAEVKLKWSHIPFKGGAPAMSSMMGGHVTAVASADFVPYVKGGTSRILVVFNPKRLSGFPDVPTLLEEGINVSLSNYIGLGVPAGVTRESQEKLHKAFLNARKDPSFKESMQKWAIEDVYRSGEELSKIIIEGYKIHGEMLKRLGIREGAQ